MTDFCQTVSMSRPFGTLSSRVIPDPTLRNLSVSCMGLLKFSLFEAVEKSVRYSIRALVFTIYFPKAPRTNTFTHSHIHTFKNASQALLLQGAINLRKQRYVL